MNVETLWQSVQAQFSGLKNSSSKEELIRACRTLAQSLNDLAHYVEVRNKLIGEEQ